MTGVVTQTLTFLWVIWWPLRQTLEAGPGGELKAYRKASSPSTTIGLVTLDWRKPS